MKFSLIESYSDTTLSLVHEKAIARGIKSQHIYYTNLMNDVDMLSKLEIDNDTILFMAVPFVANKIQQNYQSIFEIIKERYAPRKIMNLKMLEHNFLKLEDKYYQAYLFNKLKLPYAPLVDIFNINSLKYPIIARKRISSRSKNNYIIGDSNVLKTFLLRNDTTSYIFQRYFPLKKDLRVYVLGDKVIAVVERKIIMKENNRITVKIDKVGDLPAKIATQAINLTQSIGADFLGIDVGLKENGEYFFIEYNGRAQIRSSEKKVSLNIADQIVDYMASMF